MVRCVNEENDLNETLLREDVKLEANVSCTALEDHPDDLSIHGDDYVNENEHDDDDFVIGKNDYKEKKERKVQPAYFCEICKKSKLFKTNLYNTLKLEWYFDIARSVRRIIYNLQVNRRSR